MVRRILRFLFDSVVLLLTVGVGVPVAVAATVLARSSSCRCRRPSPSRRPAPFTAPTEVYDRNGNQIAEFREFDQNIPVSQADIPQVLKEAVSRSRTATSTSTAASTSAAASGPSSPTCAAARRVQGGSTITQQYVKKAYTGEPAHPRRKVREAILASQLDRQTSKDEILYRYLSTIYLGDGSYGVGAAAENYFRVPVNQLTLSEAAMLAGLIPAPERAGRPGRTRTTAEIRRELVLDKMLQQGYITQPAHDAGHGPEGVVAGQGAPPRPRPRRSTRPSR